MPGTSSSGAADPVLITAAEKEELGYEMPEAQRNPELQRLALENREQIYSIAEPYLEGVFGREVELTGIYASYPYSAINLGFRTLDEPFVVSQVYVALTGDGKLADEAAIERIPFAEIDRLTAEGLYAMAYRDEIEAIEEYLAQEYPQFGVEMPRLHDYHGQGAADVTISYDPLNVDEVDQQDEVYRLLREAYRQEPGRTDAEWRELFEVESGSLSRRIGISLVARDPGYEFTADDAKEIAWALRKQLPINDFASWGVSVRSNLMVRDANRSHHTVSVRWGTGMNGILVDEMIDGASV